MKLSDTGKVAARRITRNKFVLDLEGDRVDVFLTKHEESSRFVLITGQNILTIYYLRVC